MKVSQGIRSWLEYHNLHSKKHRQNLPVDPFQTILSKLTAQFGERDLNSLISKEGLSFLIDINQGTKQLTKRTRYSQLASFFNFIIQNLAPNFRSPCDPNNAS